MFVIEEGSEAFNILSEGLARNPAKVSFAVNEDQEKVCIKIGEAMWTPPLDIRVIRHG